MQVTKNQLAATLFITVIVAGLAVFVFIQVYAPVPAADLQQPQPTWDPTATSTPTAIPTADAYGRIFAGSSTVNR